MRTAILLALALSGCGSADRLSRIGRPPPLTPITNPAADPAWRPVAMPTPAPQEAGRPPTLLWRQGSRTFLARPARIAGGGPHHRPRRRHRRRTAAEPHPIHPHQHPEHGAPNLLGLEASTNRVLPNSVNPATLLNTNSSNVGNGQGEVRRTEAINLRVAATIMQNLPNGNMVISGRQEVRVNTELRELTVQGVLRPQDIASDNTVRHDRLAEARITYGGRGALSDVQQPRFGTQTAGRTVAVLTEGGCVGYPKAGQSPSPG